MSNLFERTQAILLNPKTTWNTIKGETTTVGQIYTTYLMPLAAIPAASMLIGRLLYGGRFGTGALVGAVLLYALTLLNVFIAGKLIDALAPNFGATKNDLNAFCVAAYAWTPSLVAGILRIIPRLATLEVLADLYCIYLLYLGLVTLMAAPPEKAIGYTVVCVVVIFVLYAITGSIVFRVAWGIAPAYPGGF